MKLTHPLFVDCCSNVPCNTEIKMLRTFKVLALIHTLACNISIVCSVDGCSWKCWLGTPPHDTVLDEGTPCEHPDVLASYIQVQEEQRKLLKNFAEHLGLIEREHPTGIKSWS